MMRRDSLREYMSITPLPTVVLFFFFNDTATTEIYTLSLHDALPISGLGQHGQHGMTGRSHVAERQSRSEEHTSELQSQSNLVCRLLLEKKKMFSLRSLNRDSPSA